MFKEYVVRVTIDHKTRDVVIVAINAFVAQVKAYEQYDCDCAIVMRDLSGCEACYGS